MPSNSKGLLRRQPGPARVLARHAQARRHRHRAPRAGRTPVHGRRGRIALGLPRVSEHLPRSAMANLGFQAVFRLLADDPRVTVERAFLPDGSRPEWPSPLRSLERRPAARRLRRASRSRSRSRPTTCTCSTVSRSRACRCGGRRAGRAAPLVLAGGPATFLNPEPIAEFVDLVPDRRGRGDARRVPRRGPSPGRPDRDATPRARRGACAERTGPIATTPRYDATGDARRRRLRRAGRRRAWSGATSRDLDARRHRHPRCSTPDAVFGDMYLVEASRGCEWGCRFCAAGFMYRPVRYRSPERLRAEHRARPRRAAAPSGSSARRWRACPASRRSARRSPAGGGRPSPSSLKADLITPALARALGAGGNRSVTVAPEAGSERMRRVINKNLTEAEILRAAEWLAGGGSTPSSSTSWSGCRPRPTPTSMASSTSRTRSARGSMAGGRPKVGRILVSINPFVPKPWTPFQWEPMEELGTPQAEARRLRRAARRRFPRCRSRPRARARRISRRCSRAATGASPPVLERLHARPDDWWATMHGAARRARRTSSIRTASCTATTAARGELLPWDFIDHAGRQALPARRAPQGARRGPDAALRHRARATRCGAC